jgi:hypothetical protein
VTWPIETAVFGSAGPSRPPVFVVGLPRAGTTLFYQALCHAYAFSYPTQLTDWLPFLPTVATRLTYRAQYVSDFTSDYGRTANRSDPAESVMWNLWLDPETQYRSANELSARTRAALIGLVGRIERVGGRPFINKNLRNTQRLPVLAELFPTAVFPVVVRDPLEVALSLLRGRIERHGSETTWLSVRPRNGSPVPNESPSAEVARQVKGLHEDLLEDMHAIGPDRFFVVSYDCLTREPRVCLERAASLLLGHGVPLEAVGSLPARFERPKRGADPLSLQQREDVAAAVTRLGLAEAWPNWPCPVIANADGQELP